jgi:drug/metabolite transporter (DMT)-like permease
MSDQRRGRLFVALAALAWSTAGLLQRELSVSTATQVAGRALFASAGLLAYVAVTERRGTLRAFRAIGIGGLGLAACAAVSSAAFLVALNHASVANVLFWQALAPILAAVAGTVLGDPVSRGTWLAMAVAVGGVAVMAGGPGHASLEGQTLSIFVSVSFAGMIVIARHRREVSMAPAMCLSQLLVLAVAGPLASTAHVGALDTTLLALLGLTQIGLGFVFLTIGSRLIPAGEVALITLLEVVLGPLWVWLFLAERPSTATLVGGVIVLAAVALQARDRGAVVGVAHAGGDERVPV